MSSSFQLWLQLATSTLTCLTNFPLCSRSQYHNLLKLSYKVNVSHFLRESFHSAYRMPGKCIFNNLWLVDADYKLWVESLPENKNRARCKVCSRDFDIGRMGESALKSHMKGSKHMALLDVKQSCSVKMPNYFATKKTTDDKPVPVTSPSDKITTYINAPELLDSEIRWVLKCVNNHFSLNSCEGINSLFMEMFPDSNLAKQFTCGPTKCAYIISYGIAPYFKSELSKTLNNLDYYTLMFDESLNKSTQSKQMDILIRYWDENENHVKTRYYTSVFLGHSTANITLKALLNALEKLSISKILNLSMDGPAVNWKIYKLLEEELQREHNCKLLNVGSCSLHILNNCFKSGAKAAGWDIDNLLVSLYWLFKDSPARREDFLVLSNGAMPKKFCAHRWLENVPAAECTIKIWENILSYIEAVDKGKFTKPSCKSYKELLLFSKDPLILVKLHCFISVANVLRPFMIQYQSDFPLLPFLADDIKKVVFDCLQSFNIFKTEKVKELKKAYNICTFDFDSKHLASISKISLGFIADRLLKELIFQKKVSDKQVIDLKYEMQKFIVTLTKDIISKSSIKYNIVRNINCFDPRYMADHSSQCYSNMKQILSVLVETKKLKDEECDSTLLQFNEFLNNEVSSSWKNFNPYERRLDEFFYKLIGSEEKYEKVWKVLKVFLVASHGQAEVERGFSTNKHLEVENLQEASYVAKRLVLDEIKQCGGIQNINITKEMKRSVAGSRQRYLEHLKEKKLQSDKSESNRKRKEFDTEIDELKEEKSCLQKSIDELQKSADSLAEKAERSSNLKYITQSNSFRRTAKEKLEQLQKIDCKINTLLCEVKKIK